MDPNTMDPIMRIIHRRMMERQRAKEERRRKILPPLSSPEEPLVMGENDGLAVTPVVEKPEPSAFLDLPFDVRRVILRYLLGLDQVRTVTRRPQTSFYARPEHDVNYSVNTAVLRTCKQLLVEGLTVLRENSFVVVPNFRPRTGRIPTWKLPQQSRSQSSLSSTSSEIKPILTVKSTEPHEKKGRNSLISILDFRLYCESWMFTAQLYQRYQWPLNQTKQGQFSFELEFVPGLAQKLWGFPNERVFLDYISTSIRDSIGPLVKTVRLGDFELNCISSFPPRPSPDVEADHDDEEEDSNTPVPPQKLTNLEQKIWDMFRPVQDPEERGRRFPTADQRIQVAFNKAERMFEEEQEQELQRNTVRTREEFKKIKDMILGSTEPIQFARLNWCLFRLATMKTAVELGDENDDGFDGNKFTTTPQDLKDLQEAKYLNELANEVIAGNEYRMRLLLRKVELLAITLKMKPKTTTTAAATSTGISTSTSRTENVIIKIISRLAWEFSPHGTEYRFQQAKLDWVHRSVHGDDDDECKNWIRWDPWAFQHYVDYRIKEGVGETIKTKIDRVRNLMVHKYGGEAKWKSFRNICYRGSESLQGTP